MKKVTCKELGGACDVEFYAETFEEIAEMSKKHGSEMFKKGDQDHLDAMHEMQNRMKSSEDMKAWFDKKRSEFLKLPESSK